MTEEEHKQSARGIIREDQLSLWDRIVPIRMKDLYHGMELGATLEILKEWNSSHDLSKCRKIMEKQGHSGMSHSLVCAMIKNFAKGTEAEVKGLLQALQ